MDPLVKSEAVDTNRAPTEVNCTLVQRAAALSSQTAFPTYAGDSVVLTGKLRPEQIGMETMELASLLVCTVNTVSWLYIGRVLRPGAGRLGGLGTYFGTGKGPRSTLLPRFLCLGLPICLDGRGSRAAIVDGDFLELLSVVGTYDRWLYHDFHYLVSFGDYEHNQG